MNSNKLEEEIEEILELCYIAKSEYGSKSCYFGKGMELKELDEWENRNGISIPFTYKEWLKFSNQCMILFDLAIFTIPCTNVDAVQDNDLVTIGKLIGDGEFLCFSKTTKEIIRYRNGIQRKYSDFKEFLNGTLIRLLQNSLSKAEKKIRIESKEEYYQHMNGKSLCVKTTLFNRLTVEERKKYLDYLKSISKDTYDNFLDDIRRQAILDFWQHERELIGEGHSTRNWSHKQIESILNINRETGMCEKQAGRP